MANNILNLAMKVTADASGVIKNLTPAERALENLGKQADKTAEIFTQFAKTNEAASRVLLQSRTDFAFLTSALKTGQITAQQFAAEYEKLKSSAEGTAAAFKEGLYVQKQYGNELANRASEVERLIELYKLGAIDLEALNNATVVALGIDEQAAASAKKRADEYAKLAAEADAIRSANLTAQEQFDQKVARAALLREQGLLSEQDFSREVERQAGLFAKATAEADGFGKSVENSAKKGLKFNELSGALSVLPGTLGNIAGRFSGIASAAEGIDRVFSGGLKSGISSLGSQLAGLANPFTLAISGLAAFSAAATAITRGLADLEGRVEQLGNTALRLGTDFQTIQVLDEAARRSGVAIDALAAGIQKLAVNINEARSGTGKAADAFRELGITQEELLTLDPASLAEKTAAALQGIEDPARRAALATETLGKAGLTLLPGFNAIGESEASLKRFAAAISDVDQGRISSLGQAFDNVKTSISGLGQNILLPFAGVAEGASNLAADSIGTVSRVAQATGAVLTPVLDTAGKGLSVLGDGLAYVNGVFDSFFGSTEKAVENAKEFRAEVEVDTKALEELQRSIENGNRALDTAIGKAGEFGQEGFKAAFEFQQALRDLADVAKEENYNGEQYARAVANATAEYEKQIATIKRVAEETKKASEEATKKAEADKKRIESLLNPNDAATKVQQDIAFVIEQQAEAEKQLAAARAAADQESANSAAARLAQLDGLRTKLEDQSQAIEQGFANGFAEAFTNTAESLDALVNKAGEFGNAGAEAAMKLQEGVAAAQEQVRDGIIPKPVYEAEIAEQRRVFEERIAQLEAVRQQERAAAAERFQLEVDANQRVNDFIAQQAQTEVAAAEQVAARRQQAAFNIEAIEQRIALERQSLEAAREQNDLNAARAAVQRIDSLKEALTVEQKIAAGREQELQKQQQLLTNQQEFQKQQLAAAQQYQQQQQAAQQAYAKEQARIFEEQQKAAAAEAKRQEERLAKLNTLGDQTIGVQDVRTSQGANLVLDLAANAQDPALIQQRLQTKLLERIALGVGQAASNYFNQPVAIVGASRIG